MPAPTILWADDEIELLSPYTIFLQQKGYRVLTASNGVDAIEIARSEQPDIIFLDEMMPGLSGLETLVEIKRRQPSVPVVMITKSEEENIMDMAIGEKIADYLIKPVNPSQILLCLKKHLHQKSIIEQHTSSSYRQEFQDIAARINSARTIEDFQDIHRELVRWDLELEASDSSMRELLQMQRKEAEKVFAQFIRRNYEQWFDQRNSNQRPIMSPDVMKTAVLPLLDKGEKVCLMVFDNLRYDQWKAMQPIVSELFDMEQEALYTAILPTSTQYARNAIFSGLMPLQIKQMFPEYWVEEGDEDSKNQYENQLTGSFLQRYRRNFTYNYCKIHESDFAERVIRRIQSEKGDNIPQLQVVVVNFIDMLSHSRTESKMMRELASDEAAYRSLTVSWLRHSPTYELLRQIASKGYTLVLTTDHGTTRVNNAVSIIGDKNTNTNIRYKVGKALSCKSKDVVSLENPQRVGLPAPNLSSSYVFCTGDDFFAYPNNFNYYVQFFRDTFQHGGVSMDEMIVPLVTLRPKQTF